MQTQLLALKTVIHRYIQAMRPWWVQKDRTVVTANQRVNEERLVLGVLLRLQSACPVQHLKPWVDPQLCRNRRWWVTPGTGVGGWEGGE